jgi:geranylgeranyl diphosphate synthase type I
MTSKQPEPEPSEHKLTLETKRLLWEKGREGLEMARKIMSEEEIPSSTLRSATDYFMASWEDVLHSALLELTCEAVGGKPNSANQIGAALILMAGGADIHDDVIDESAFKYGRETVFGKFDRDIAVLTGDAFIVTGLNLLHEACEKLSTNVRAEVLRLVRKAFFGISSAEAKESALRKEGSIVPEEYLEMIKTKSAVSEATARIGAIIGGGSDEEVEILAGFGRCFGILMTVKDEFIDIFELEEMRNRLKNEWLPLPILYTMKDKEKASELVLLLRNGRLTKRKLERVLEIVLESEGTDQLRKEMCDMIKAQEEKLRFIERNQEKFLLMLQSSFEDL